MNSVTGNASPIHLFNIFLKRRRLQYDGHYINEACTIVVILAHKQEAGMALGAAYFKYIVIMMLANAGIVVL